MYFHEMPEGFQLIVKLMRELGKNGEFENALQAYQEARDFLRKAIKPRKNTWGKNQDIKEVSISQYEFEFGMRFLNDKFCEAVAGESSIHF